MADGKRHQLTCPDCGGKRLVTLSHVCGVRRGESSPRCRPCYLAAKSPPKPRRVPLPCPSCKAVRMVSAEHARNLKRWGSARVCIACHNRGLSAARSVKAKLCRHCKDRNVNRPRGLCWECYYAPGVKELYPSTSKYARRHIPNFSGEAPLPASPTDAPAGSLDKMRVLHARAMRGEALFHPDDSREIRAEEPFHTGDYRGGDDNGLQAPAERGAA